MKVILREDVPALGKAGDVVEVKRGFGRNYLVPRKKAVLATEASLKHVEHEKQVAVARKAKQKAAAGDLAGRLEAAKLTIGRRVGEQDKLYGSVTALDIAEALTAQGISIDRRSIHLPEPIKQLGDFEVEVRLHSEVIAKVKLTVAAEH
ncbi:MAG TPA: 50S ribosomal protein L9 [Myxococcales bacterium]|nr:50S ribosomal protein L9 [Myxococcales bacterium]